MNTVKNSIQLPYWTSLFPALQFSGCLPCSVPSIRRWQHRGCESGCSGSLPSAASCFLPSASAGVSPLATAPLESYFLQHLLSYLHLLLSQKHRRLLWLKFWCVVDWFVCCGAGWKWLWPAQGSPDLFIQRSPQQPFVTPKLVHYSQCRCLAIFTIIFFCAALVWFFWGCLQLIVNTIKSLWLW